MKNLSSKIFLFFLCSSIFLFSQWEPRYSSEVDITTYLQKIDSGKKIEVMQEIPELKKRYPNDPSIKYLSGILEEDGDKAIAIFRGVVEFSPKSKYADAAAFRLYSYYYSIGVYDKARLYYQKLKKDYPSSPYLKLTKKNIPNQNQVVAEVQKPKTETVKQTNDSEKTTKLIGPVQNQKSTEKYEYKIQAGAFSKEENAASLNKSFIDSGYDSAVIQKNVGGTVFHVVIVGRFKTDDEAKSFLNLINSKFGLAGRIIPYND